MITPFASYSRRHIFSHTTGSATVSHSSRDQWLVHGVVRGLVCRAGLFTADGEARKPVRRQLVGSSAGRVSWRSPTSVHAFGGSAPELPMRRFTRGVRSDDRTIPRSRSLLLLVTCFIDDYFNYLSNLLVRSFIQSYIRLSLRE